MRLEKKDPMKGSALKALRLANDQLINANKPYLLHMAASVLGTFINGPLNGVMMRDCPKAYMLAEWSQIFCAPGAEKRIANLMGYQFDDAFKKTCDAICECADAFEKIPLGTRHDGDIIAARNLARAARDYFSMARSIQNGRGNGKIVAFVQVRPDITARFAAEYLLPFSKHLQGSDYEGHALALRTKILNALDGTESAPALAALPAAKTENLMNLLWKVSTFIYNVDKASAKVPGYQRAALSFTMESLFGLCGSYNWKQYEKKPAAIRLATPAAVS